MTNTLSSVGHEWAERFKALPDVYRLSEGLPFLRKFARSPFVQLPARFARLAPGSRVLEAGCASGKFSVCFARMHCAVTALDFSPAMLANVADLRARVEAETGALAIQSVAGDLENLALEPDQFDLVMNEGVVEHWLDHTARRHVLREMARVAKPGGAVAIIIPNGRHPLATYWIAHHPGFISAPPMVRYDPNLVRADLTAIGLRDVCVDGIYAWRTLDQWPNHRALQILGGALQRLVPLPRAVRLRWGIHLIGMGRKQ